MSYSSAIGPRVQRNDVKGELSYLEQKGIENFRRLAYHLRAFLHAHRRVRVALEISRGQSGGVRAETPADRNIASCKCACMCAARLKTSPSRFIPWNIISWGSSIVKRWIVTRQPSNRSRVSFETRDSSLNRLRRFSLNSPLSDLVKTPSVVLSIFLDIADSNT